ncbi:MAG: PEP-CTERM sorting domain-containing protein [Akkermansiaceae bacterium]
MTIAYTSFFVVGLLAAPNLSAHTTYGGTARNLGVNQETTPGSGVFMPAAISGASAALPYFKTITNQTVTSNFGWAAGTDVAYGDAHHIRAFRFTLAEAGYATLNVTADSTRGTAVGFSIMPAFSLYSGLLSTGSADYDTAGITLAWLQTLGNPQPRNGALNSLDDWKIGNDASLADGQGAYNFNELSSLAYIGNVADGTSANFGAAAGVNGDGVADGSVQQSYWLLSGDYTVIIGGAEIAENNLMTFGINASLTVIPEPSSTLMIGLAGLGLALRRRR